MANSTSIIPDLKKTPKPNNSEGGTKKVPRTTVKSA